METLDIGKRLKDPRRGKRGAAIVVFIVAKGWVRFQNIYEGWAIAGGKDVYKR
jgi:hypothetical protein